MSQYIVRGTYSTREGDRDFEKRVDAPNEDVATERTYAAFGSEHNRTRPEVAIEEVEQA